jgi:hypothetical protein
MYEKYELTENEIEKYGLKNCLSQKEGIRNKQISLILVELQVHYSEIPDRSFCLLLQDEKLTIHSSIESYSPLIVRLSSYINSDSEDKGEYAYAKIIRDSITAFNAFYRPNNAWYSVSITNEMKPIPIPKSETQTIDNIITSLCLHGRQRSLSFSDLSKSLILSLSYHGFGREDLEKFIASQEYKLKLKDEGKKFIEFWIKEGKEIKDQFEAIKPPLAVSKFFEFSNE